MAETTMAETPTQVRYAGMNTCCVAYCLTNPGRFGIVTCPNPKCGGKMKWENGAWESTTEKPVGWGSM